MSLYHSKTNRSALVQARVLAVGDVEATMRNISVWAVASLASAYALGCSAGGSGTPGSHTTGPNGSTGGSASNGGSGPSNLGNVGNDPSLDPTDNGPDGAPEDPEPENPNITHPKCGAGKCTDFPDQPIIEMGAPMNAPSLFGADPAAFTPGSLCALEPQLSANGKEGAMMPAN